MKRFATAAGAALLALSLSPLALAAQAPRPAPALAIPNPHYATIHLTLKVDRPAAEVWSKVGQFCQISQWLHISCKTLTGPDNQANHVGEVRVLGPGIHEILVGKTALSYTYTQPVLKGRPYNLYHGTLEARPLTATSCRLIYTLVFDNSMLPGAAARERDLEARRRMFTKALKTMKAIADGGGQTGK